MMDKTSRAVERLEQAYQALLAVPLPRACTGAYYIHTFCGAEGDDQV